MIRWVLAPAEHDSLDPRDLRELDGSEQWPCFVPSWGDVRGSLTPGLDVLVLWVTVLPSQGDPSHPGGYSRGRFDPPPGQWATSAAHCKVHCCDFVLTSARIRSAARCMCVVVFALWFVRTCRKGREMSCRVLAPRRPPTCTRVLFSLLHACLSVCLRLACFLRDGTLYVGLAVRLVVIYKLRYCATALAGQLLAIRRGKQRWDPKKNG